MVSNKKTYSSLLGLISLVLSVLVFFSINYMWLFVPYQGRTGIIKIIGVNAICVAGFFWGKQKLLEGKKGPR